LHKHLKTLTAPAETHIPDERVHDYPDGDSMTT
jgi:hypothetical protein